MMGEYSGDPRIRRWPNIPRTWCIVHSYGQLLIDGVFLKHYVERTDHPTVRYAMAVEVHIVEEI